MSRTAGRLGALHLIPVLCVLATAGLSEPEGRAVLQSAAPGRAELICLMIDEKARL